jgi:hypothetical protein
MNMPGPKVVYVHITIEPDKYRYSIVGIALLLTLMDLWRLYAKPKPEELLEEYLKAEDNLTIYNTSRLNDISTNQQALATDIRARPSGYNLWKTKSSQCERT